MAQGIRTAVIHDWLIGMRGGEKVLEAILELFPDADVFTLIYEPEKVSEVIRSHRVHTSCLQQIPGAKRHYRKLLPLFPTLIERFDLSEYDLIVSSSHCVAKGVKKRTDAVHLSYVHAPMRYMWDRFDEYFGADVSGMVQRKVAHWVRPYLQRWDRVSSQEDRVDRILANSHYIAESIQNFWNREAHVVYPFVDLERYANIQRDPQDFYLLLGAFAPYKRVDLAIEALGKMGKKVWVAGSGQDAERVQKAASRFSDTQVRLLGNVSDEEVLKLYAQARALIFPGKEDFGITPLESLAAGCPVIALREGGALDTLTDQTGVWIKTQSVSGIQEAIADFEARETQIQVSVLHARAHAFSKQHFQQSFLKQLLELWAEKGPATLQQPSFSEGLLAGFQIQSAPNASGDLS